jgi:hypothetical protein
MAYPHPDDEGGFMLVTDPCPECVRDGLCAMCGQGMMEWGALQICVRCGFTFDAADVPVTAEWRVAG